MTPSYEARYARKNRRMFSHALWMDDSIVCPPCELLLVHPDVSPGQPGHSAPGENVFGFYVLTDEELQQAMQNCVRRVMRCTFLEPGVRQCRVEVVQDNQARWFRHDGEKFKRLSDANQKSEGDQLRPPCEG